MTTAQKKYKEGDIVDVPYGMRIIREKKQQKSWLTGWADKRKKYKEEGTIVPEGEAEDEEGADEEGADYPIGDDEDQGDQEDQDQEDQGDQDDTGDGDEVDPLPTGKPKYEIQEDWVYKKVPIYTTSAAEKLASDMGLPIHHEKLVKINIRRRVEEVQITHAGVYRMRVGKNGKLLPLEGEKRTISVFDEDDLDVPRVSTVSESFKPAARRVEQNPYNDIYNFGTYVKFSRDGIDREGIVMVYTEYSVGVSVKMAGEVEMFFVDYEDASLQKTKIPKREQRLHKIDITADDVYVSTEIPPEIRKTVIDTYVSILDQIRTSKSKKGSDVAISPVTPSSAKATLKRVMLKEKPRGPLAWNDYYAENFARWISSEYHDLFVKQVNIQKVARIAESATKQESDPVLLLKEISEYLPGGSILFDTTVSDILDVMSKVSQITVFQGMCIQALQKEKYSGRGNMSGTDLATLLSNIIESYYRTHPPDTDAYYKYIFDLEVEQLKDVYEPTEQDRAMFEGKYLDALKVRYEESVASYEKERVQYEEEMKEREANRILELPKGASSREVKTSPLHNDNREEVERFELLVFATKGSSVHSYMSSVMLPHIFLEGPLAKHANFFRAKIANGAFPFSALGGANIAHYLPEFAMNKKLTDEDWDKVGGFIGTVLHNDIASVVDTYVNILNPTAQIQYSGVSYLGILDMISSLENLLVDPIAECNNDTSTGYRRVITVDPSTGKQGKYILDPDTMQLLDQRIPYGDLAICYDATSAVFTCHSTRDVMLSIARGDLINPHTKKPYPEDFIDRIRKRNKVIISDMKQPEAADPLPSPVKKAKSPEKPKSVVKPKVSPKKIKAIRKRHVAPSKGTFESITNMLLLGDIEKLALFESSFSFPVETEDGVIDNEVPITYDRKDSDINVAVLTFYADLPSSIEDLKKQMKLVPAKVKKIYVAGLDSAKVFPVARVTLATKIKKILPGVKKVFYSDGHTDDDMKDILIDVSVDVEGIRPIE